jgi:hypothetical protein
VKLTEAIDIYIKSEGIPGRRTSRAPRPGSRAWGGGPVFIQRMIRAGRPANPGPKEDVMKPTWNSDLEIFELFLPDGTAVCEKTAAACATTYLEKMHNLRTTIESQVAAEILSHSGTGAGNDEQ